MQIPSMASLQLIRGFVYAAFAVFHFSQVQCQKNIPCGKAGGPALEGRVSGDYAEQGAWPWVVAIVEGNSRDAQSPSCTGYLIDQKHVISAASCFDRTQSSLYSIRIGNVNPSQGEEYSISNIAVHEGFRKGQLYNDIALVTLSKEVDTQKYNPICLPGVRNFLKLEGKETAIVAWGSRRPGGPASLKQFGPMPVVSNSMCNSSYSRRSPPLLSQGLTSAMLCAGFQDKKGKSSCRGETGGPLMFFVQKKWYAVGVATLGYMCNRQDSQGVYTRMNDYVVWIKEKKEENVGNPVTTGNGRNPVITANPATTGNVATPGDVVRIGPNNNNNVCSQSRSPWFSEHCVDVRGQKSPCTDIRECEFAPGILALGGLPRVCGWLEAAADQGEQEAAMKWPKVCCGMPQALEHTLVAEHVREINNIGPTLVDFTAATEPGPTFPDHCILPMKPENDTSVNPEDGYRFGNTPFSRQEFPMSSEYLEGINHESLHALQFKTLGTSGVLFYVNAKGSNRDDFIALIMKNGKMIFIFENGSGTAIIPTENVYNDGQWHKAVFWRRTIEGQLIVDNDEEVRGKAPGGNTRVDELKGPLLIGGLTEDFARKHKQYLQGVIESFPGCIRNVEADNELLEDETSTLIDTTGCTNQVEAGAFFYEEGGHIVLSDKYRVGHRIYITLEIKPRSLSGVLLAVYARRSYFILQMVDGRIEFTVDNGGGAATASFAPGGNHRHYLCDGEFHTVQATKSNNVVSVSVDGMLSTPVDSVNRGSSTATLDPVHVGGLPEALAQRAGLQTTEPYVGCMRNLEIDSKIQSLSQSKLYGQVNLNTCPTN